MTGPRLLVSPAALCLWAIALCIGFSVAGSNASRIVTLKQESKFGTAQTVFPIQMRRWDGELFVRLSAAARSDMAEFLKNAEQEAANKAPETEDADFKPSVQSVRYIEQFRSLTLVSYLGVMTAISESGSPVITFKTVNFDKAAKRELGLGDLFEGVADRSAVLEALAAYARAALKDQTGEEDAEESTAILELTKPDLNVYERFTLCPSTKVGKAAGLTIHFAPELSGPYAGSDFHPTVPYTVFSKFLKPGMRALFSGEPRQIPVELQDSGA